MAKKMTKKELIEKKGAAYENVTAILLDIFGFTTNPDGSIVSADYGFPIIYNGRKLKRHTLYHIADIDRDEQELNLLMGNVNILEVFVDNYLDKINFEYVGYGMTFHRGKKSTCTPDMYSWGIVIDNENDEALDSNRYIYKNFGLIELICKIDGVNVKEELELICRER